MDMTFTLTNGTEKELGKWLIFLMIKATYTILMFFKKTGFRLEKRELICLLLFTCYYVVSVWRVFLFLLVLGMGYVILLWHLLCLPLIILCKRDISGFSIPY